MKKIVNCRLTDVQIKELKDIAKKADLTASKVMELSVVYAMKHPEILEEAYQIGIDEKRKYIRERLKPLRKKKI